MEVQGVCKSTVVRGEDDFDNGVLRVTDCHDSIVYALAPLQYASVTCCSDCTVVLGAVGKVRCPHLPWPHVVVEAVGGEAGKRKSLDDTAMQYPRGDMMKPMLKQD